MSLLGAVDVPRVRLIALRNSGLRVAIEDAIIPTPFSTVDQMVKSVKMYKKSTLWVNCQM